MRILVIGLGRPGNNTVDSMFFNVDGEFNFLNVDGNEYFIRTCNAPTLLLNEEIMATEDPVDIAIRKEVIQSTISSHDIIFLVIWPYDHVGYGTVAFPIFAKYAKQFNIPAIGIFIASSHQSHKLELIKKIVCTFERDLFASMRIMLDSLCEDLPKGLSTEGFMYNVVGPELIKSVDVISTTVESHNLRCQKKSLGLIKTGYGISGEANRVTKAMVDALTHKMINYIKLKDASKIWVTTSSSQPLWDSEIEDMKMMITSAVGDRKDVSWSHKIDIELFDNFEVRLVVGGRGW
jgi:cell division GTPase FtsZ